MTSIVSVTPGNYTPGAESALNAMADVINAAWTEGNTKSTDFSAKVSAATTGFLDVTTAPHVTAGTVSTPSVIEPDVNIPATASVTDVLSTFDTKYLELVALLADKFTTFKTTHFPDDQTAYASVEDLLQAAIADPSTGIPAAVAAQIIEDDKSRILADASRASDTVLATFASRRYPMPPGMAASAIADIQQKAQGEIAASSRKVVIGSIEQMRWVIEQTKSLRQIAMGTALDYIKALASGPDMASKLVSVGYDAQSKLISAASQFYNSRTAVAELSTKVGQFNVQTALEAATKNQASDLTLIEDKLKVLILEANGIAQMATSLFNNVRSGASVGYNVNGT